MLRQPVTAATVKPPPGDSESCSTGAGETRHTFPSGAPWASGSFCQLPLTHWEQGLLKGQDSARLRLCPYSYHLSTQAPGVTSQLMRKSAFSLTAYKSASMPTGPIRTDL